MSVGSVIIAQAIATGFTLCLKPAAFKDPEDGAPESVSLRQRSAL
jgi:hypothetical protein